MARSHKNNKNEVAEMLSLIGQIAITMLVPILACTAVGYFIGKRINGGAASGVASVIGFFIGAVAGFQSVWRLVKKYIEKKK